MAKADADRNLLFGILALQMDFVSREALIAAVSAWVRDKTQPLDQILVAQGALARDEHALLEPLVRKHLEKHGGDPARSLNALSTIGPVRKDLEQVADPDVRASLAAAPAARAEDDDPYVTRTSGAGALSGDTPRFRILRPHARGGLGEVFVAHDEELNRQVALKEIQEQHADRADSRSRFVLEAEITGALEHPGVVPVYGLGHNRDGRPYYAMRFIQGDNLNNAIKRFHQGHGRDPGARTLAFRKLLGRFVDVCNAMAYAHSKGVLHRDLKPDNIMLGKYGETLVVDWGLAKAIGRADPSLPTEESPVRPASGRTGVETLPGRAFGTPQFMSPEQAAGDLDRMGPTSDVYSLGATLYAVLTGRVAFEDRDPGLIIQKVMSGEFPHPRQINRQVPAALEAACLKAMALKPEDRYGSARALADDIESWLADEPISAWREPWTVRTRRWMARHRTLVTSAAAALVVGLTAVGYVRYEAQIRATLRLAQANGRVDALETADIREVPGIIHQLQPDRRLVLDRLRIQARTDPAGRRRRLHVALALLPDDPTQVEVLAGRLQQADARPDEVIVIRQALQDHGHAAALTPRLWALVKPTGTELTDPQLRAAGALALFDPKNARWPALGPPVAAKLVQENPLLIGAWREAFQPVIGALAEPLRAIYGDRDRPEERALAYTLLFEFATQPGNPSRHEDLAELVAETDPAQFHQLLGLLQEDRPRAVARLASKLEKLARFDDALARRQGRVATALVALGKAERVWPLMKHRDDPSVRTELIHDLGRFGVDPGVVIARLKIETEVSARRALILALGGFSEDRIPVQEREALATLLRRWYHDNPDPGVHGGIDWLLRQRWGLGVDLDQIDQELAGPDLPKGRDWYVNGQGQTFAVIRGPVEFLMGSTPESDAERGTDEVQHLCRIDRSFAIATKEVTVAQYTRFLNDNPDVANFLEQPQFKQDIPSPDCAMGDVDWYEAVRYCNWLSQQEGIAEDQWCYPKEIGPEMKMPPDWLERVGYRLPTEAEWEYACRAGAMSARPYGGSEDLLPEFGWFLSNANQMHPAGQKKPNDLGLFDILGNAYDWSHDAYVAYPTITDGKPLLDAGVDAGFSENYDRILRGGSFYNPAAALRSAYRNWNRPMYRFALYGVRPVRTCP